MGVVPQYPKCNILCIALVSVPFLLLRFWYVVSHIVSRSQLCIDKKMKLTSHERRGVSNHRYLKCLFIRLFRATTKVCHSQGARNSVNVSSVDNMDEQYWVILNFFFLNSCRCPYSISQEICTRFCCALLCCGYVIVHNEFTWSIYPYSLGLLCWHWGNR